MAAVFVIDDAFVISEYLQFLVYASSVALGLSTLVFLPLSLLGERLAKRSKHTIWVYPGFVCLCTGAILAIRSIILNSLLDAFLGWNGYVVLISFFFALYWTILWFGKAALASWRKLRERRRSKKSLEADLEVTGSLS